MILVIYGICLIVQAVTGAPINEQKPSFKKRDLGESFPLIDIISNVEDSLIKEAYAAGSIKEINKFRNERQAESDGSNKSPKTQLSILTVKLNSPKPKDPTKNPIASDPQKESDENLNHSTEDVKDRISDKSKNEKDYTLDVSKDKSNSGKDSSDVKQTKKDSKDITKEQQLKIKNENNSSKDSANDKNAKDLVKEKLKVVNKVAEVEVNPVILATRV